MMSDFFMIDLVTAATLITIALLLFMMITLFIMKHKQISRSRVYHESLVEEQERSMQAISEEVHDDIGQHLYVARTKVVLLQDVLGPEYHSQMQELAQVIDKALDSTHAISHALNSKSLKQLGLVASIEENIKLLNSTRSLTTVLDVEGRPFLLEPGRELIIYRIYQEAMSNVMKHSSADRAWVSISYDERRLTLSVRDNGCGYTPRAVRNRGGIGLYNMEERAALLPGNLYINSTPGQGTLVLLKVPLKARADGQPVLAGKPGNAALFG